MNKEKKPTRTLDNALRELLQSESSGTQEEICHTLSQQGYSVSQSKISRILKKLRAVKIQDELGRTVYWLPKEPPPPILSNLISSLIINISANENMVLVNTDPGSASLISRLIDYQRGHDSYILGTIAGDDTILIIPKSIQEIQKMFLEIKGILQK